MFKTVESNEEADITEKKSKFIANIFILLQKKKQRKNKTNKKKA